MGAESGHLLKETGDPVKTLKIYDQKKHRKEVFLDKTI
jgi:hypothetical protein